LVVRRPDARTAVISVFGELDEVTAPRLDELLRPRLDSTLKTMVLDFSRLDFLGVAALHMLAAASRRADARQIALRVMAGPPCVERALRATGLADHFDREFPHHRAA
jgi:anti-anti-sigma factor